MQCFTTTDLEALVARAEAAGGRVPEPVHRVEGFGVSVVFVMNSSRAVINGMCERGHGRILTISFGAGTVGLNLGVSPYAAGKGGAIKEDRASRGPAAKGG